MKQKRSEDIGDDKEEVGDNGDQKQKAYKKRRAPKTNDVNQRRMKITKRTADNTPRCAQNTDPISYYRKFPNSRRSNIVLPKQTQNSSMLTSSAILMTSSNALQVVLIVLISCRVHQMKSIDILNSIMS